MSAFCTQCGAPIPANQKFCTRCGTAVDSNPPAAAAQTKQAAPAAPTTPPVSGFGKSRAIVVAALVVAGAALAAALVMIGPESPPSPPKSSTAAAPPKAVPPAAPPATVAAPPAGSATTAIKASRWEGYTNTRYGVMIDYPADLFAIQPPPPDNAGRNFAAEKAGARFHIHSHANAMNFSAEELQAEDVLDIGDAAAVKTSGTDWYQVVASKEAETIVRRVVLSEGGATVHRLEVAYPKTSAAAFEPIVARMVKSFRVDPSIPEKAANAAGSPVPAQTGKSATTLPEAKQPESKRPETSKPAWQRFDSIALGMRIPGYSGKAGVSAEVPANWTRSDMPEPNVIEFQGLEAAGDDVLHVTFRAERRGAKATVASEAKIIKTRLSEGADNYRLLSERTTQIALRPAIVFSMQFSGSDSPDLLREDVAIIDAGQVFYIVTFGAPQARYAASSNVFTHVLETIGFAE
ncbi:MAG: zinc ribbon domain-containing protein [Pseudomonadota bacterium]